MNDFHTTCTIPLRPTVMEVNLYALAANYRAFVAHAAPAKVMAVMKANAYGHGLVPCAQRLAQEGVPYIGVAIVEEGIELRHAGITVPILVLGGIFGEQIRAVVEHGLELTASSVSKLQQIEETARLCGKKARVHLKFDTGMERIGVHYYSAEPLIEAALKCTHCEVAGIYSHFALADAPEDQFTDIQLERFLEIARFFERRGLPTPLRHIANSPATLARRESHLDMVRPGLSLFGLYPALHLKSQISLLPVMTLKSRVVYFKVVKAGAGVSYGHRWTAPTDTRVATIPIGYGDGYFRLLSNRGKVLIRGNAYPIVGSVCMDQLMVDLGPKGEAYNGDEVVLIGKQGDQEISANDLAALVGTIPYEILTSINTRVPRVYTEGR